MDNFDTTSGQPFIFTTQLTIRLDPATRVIHVTATEQTALKGGDGVTRLLEGVSALRTFAIHPSEMEGEIPVYDMATGQPIEGQETTVQEVMRGVYSVLQNRRIGS